MSSDLRPACLPAPHIRAEQVKAGHEIKDGGGQADRAAEVVGAARRIADEVLWPRAGEIDRAPIVPSEILDQLAAAGLYGVAGPLSAGGSGSDPSTMGSVIEALGGASLATAFVWIQHHSTVRAVTGAPPSLRERWLPALCAGRVRSGIAIAALRRPGPPAMVATPDGAGLLLDGWAPWVTGWGLVDVVLVAARDGEDIVWSLIDAQPGPTLRAERLSLAAVDSSATVLLSLSAHPVPESRVVGREPYSAWLARDAGGLAQNGFLAVGVAARCAALIASEALVADTDRVRLALLTAGPAEVVSARAEASLLAVRAATAVVASGGGRSVEADDPAQRLAREAMFLMVFGQTRDIRAAQVSALASTGWTGLGPASLGSEATSDNCP